MPGATGAVVATSGLVALAAAGVVLGATGTVDLVGDQEASVVAPAEVAYYDCPDGGALGNLHGGDRVLATGVDGSGDWVEVRSPLDLDARVWVPGEAVEPDRSLDDLPAVECSWTGPDATGGTTPSSEETVPSTDTAPPTTGPTTVPTTGTLAPGQTLPPGVVPPGGPGAVTTTTGPGGSVPPDTSDPFVTGIAAAPRDIWESGCIDPTTEISATVRDDRDPTPTVTLEWRVGNRSGSGAMQQAGTTFRLRIGPFPVGTLAEIHQTSAPVRLILTARDDAGNTTVRDVSDRLTLWACD